MSKKVYICYGPYEGVRGAVGEGNSLKAAYEDYREVCNDNGDEACSADDATFVEGETVEVEVKIQRKEVVTKITAKPVASKADCK